MIVFSALNIYAQPRVNVDEQVQRLTNDLGLSKEQATRVEEILTDSKGKADKLKDSGLDRREMMTQMRDLMETANNQIESILNDGQLVRFREMVEKRKEEMRSRGPREFKN
jgi:hypothetical protein